MIIMQPDIYKRKRSQGLIGISGVILCFRKWLLISCTIAPLGLFDGYHLRLNKNGRRVKLKRDDGFIWQQPQSMNINVGSFMYIKEQSWVDWHLLDHTPFFYKGLLISSTIAPLSLFIGYHVRWQQPHSINIDVRSLKYIKEQSWGDWHLQDHTPILQGTTNLFYHCSMESLHWLSSEA